MRVPDSEHSALASTLALGWCNLWPILFLGRIKTQLLILLATLVGFGLFCGPSEVGLWSWMGNILPSWWWPCWSQLPGQHLNSFHILPFDVYDPLPSPKCHPYQGTKSSPENKLNSGFLWLPCCLVKITLKWQHADSGWGGNSLWSNSTRVISGKLLI